MRYLKNMVLAGVTLFLAGGIRFVMQSSPVAEMRYGPATTGVSLSTELSKVPAYIDTQPFSGNTALELTAIAYTSAPALRLFGTDAALPPRPHMPNPLSVGEPQPDLVSDKLGKAATPPQAHDRGACDPVLLATPRAAAMVLLELTSPCTADQRVTLHHNGMMITESTNSDGKLSVQIPALARQAVFMAAFDNGSIAMARTEVTSLDIYDRVVVQWAGPGELQIHALEFGADYGDEGHVWAMAPQDVQRAVAGLGGFVSLHGRSMPDQDLRAQVYTFPTATTGQTGDVALSIEAEVTDQTCGRRIEAQALQITGGGALSVKDLTLNIPDCAARGDFLVLKNILEDLKIARN
jgi:hypothetical protein